jgi:hypothetical protein
MYSYTTPCVFVLLSILSLTICALSIYTSAGVSTQGPCGSMSRVKKSTFTTPARNTARRTLPSASYTVPPPLSQYWSAADEVNLSNSYHKRWQRFALPTVTPLTEFNLRVHTRQQHNRPIPYGIKTTNVVCGSEPPAIPLKPIQIANTDPSSCGYWSTVDPLHYGWQIFSSVIPLTFTVKNVFWNKDDLRVPDYDLYRLRKLTPPTLVQVHALRTVVVLDSPTSYHREWKIPGPQEHLILHATAISHDHKLSLIRKDRWCNENLKYPPTLIEAPHLLYKHYECDLV